MEHFAALTTLSLLSFVLCLASAAVCPQGWISNGNYCYKFSFTSLAVRGKSWENAENTCQSFGSHLASITSQSEQNFISSNIRKYKNDHFWIGYNDRANESNFNWTDGTDPSIYKNWRWNEPNDFKNNEDCTELLFSDGKWNDDDCKKEYAFICKIKQGVPIPTQPPVQPPTTLTPLECDAGWKHYGTSCYNFNLVKRKWVDARRDCRQSGGYLLKVDDGDEQHYITYKMKSITQNMWIGLNDRAVEGIYIWEGDLMVANNYTNWYSGEPNDHAGNEDCIAVYNGFLAGYWNDDYCDSAKGYICEKPNSQNLCPINWVPYDNSCYQLNAHPAQSLSWQQAVNACRAIQGSDLVSIHSSGEQLFLTKQLNDLKSRNVWIGLNDIVKEGLFLWSDRSTLDYKNWGRYEPGSGWIGNYRDCSQLIVNAQNGTWGTSYCNSKNPYVCKMSRASMKCNAPLGLANSLIGDSQITASSSKDSNSQPSQARLMLQPTGGLSGSWCAANNKKGEYLQIDLGLNRRIGHIAVQGRPKSTDFVKSFYLTYGSDGLTFITYGQTPKQKFKLLAGSVNSDTVADIMLDEKITGRFIRIYPQTWSNNICMRAELYGCEGQVSSVKCGLGWEEGPDNTCYQFNTNQLKMWADARATCKSRGGDLLSIVSNKERIFIDKRIKSLSSSVNSMWIGLNDRESSKLFYWSDQSPYLVTRWDAGYPKDNNNSKSCVELVPSRAAWRDVDCGQYKPFVCKNKLQASKNQPKYSKTANWLSATDFYWPLNNLVNGKVLGSSVGKVMGTITKPDILQNSKDVLQFNGYNSYIQAGDFPSQCISDTEACSNGISVSLIIKLDSTAASWSGKRFLVDSIGDEAFTTSRGFAIYLEGGQIKIQVLTKRRYWSLRQSIRTGVWQHVAFTWTTAAVKLYIDGRQRSSSVNGVFLQVDHSNDNVGMTIGSSSSNQVQGSYYMRALAVWYRELSAAEIKDIYNAEFGSCKFGWKEFGQFCYQFNFEQKNWQSARLQCQKQGGDLTSINSPVEQAHISLEVGEFGLGRYAWIGFHDKNIESAWEWSDGTTPRFTNWYNLQPDNWYNNEHCGHTYPQWYAAGRWNDISCYANFAYICKSKKAYIPTGGVIPTASAPKSKIICESTSSFISCPTHTVISVKSANFGRTSANQCGQISVTNCRLDVLAKIQSMCDGKTYCTLRADLKLGKDPCPSIRKYLEVSFACKKGPVATPGCPAGWPRSPDGNVCYGLILEKKNWFDAKDSCRSLGAELVSIHSVWESSLVTSLLVTSWDAGDIWIGLTDSGSRGVYRWADNSTVDFTHWFNSEPNDRNVKGSCVRATMTSGTRDLMYWVDSDCNINKLAYVCKMFRRNFNPPTKPPTTIPTGPCPTGWRTYMFGCYKVFMQMKTWTSARDSCRGLGRSTNLVSILDAAENSFVQTLTNNTFDAWIGLNDRGTLSGHVWSDGSAVRFTNWGPAQPDSHSGQQPCVTLKSTGIWNDVGCYSTRPYMCKMTRPAYATSPAPSTNPPKPTTEDPKICDPGWVYWNQLCYHFGNESLFNQRSWFESRAVCRKARGDLVSIRNMAENQFLTKEVQKRYRGWNIWIGLNDLGTEGVYSWSDGSPLSFTYFAYKEPNDWMKMEDCVELRRYNGKWNDQSCSLKRPFICRKHNNTVIPAFTMVPPTPGPAVGKCMPGWVNYDKSCYKFVFKERQNWVNAQSVCQKGINSSMSGNLISIDNVYEQAFVSTMIKDNQANLWIGLNDLHTEGTYSWISNVPVTYVNWEKGKPSYNYWADCVAVKTGKVSIGRWDVQVCSAFQGYICEAAALPLGPTPVTPTPSNDCPAQFTKFGDSCYMTSYMKSTWYEANQKCKSYGANLVSIHSSVEQAYLVRNMINFVGDIWTGLSREFNVIEFTWSDQSSKEYTHWSRGQPGQPSASKTCVQANNSLSTDGRWTEVDCGRKNGFMCKISKGEPGVTPSLLGQCQPGWTKYEKYCYLLKPNNYLPWPQARLSCIRQGGDLVSVLNRQEQDFLIYQLKDTKTSSLWIGLNDRALEGGYQWSDGSPTLYIPWSAGEPNDRFGNENCVELYPRSGAFNDHICSQRRGYICKSKLECSLPLGMSSGNITNSQLTASSTLDASHGPSAARLNSSSAWCANASIPNNYLQVDFLSQTRISKISIQGTTKGLPLPSYVRSFRLTYGSYQNQWVAYMANGQPKIISANTNAYSVVTIALNPPIDARYVRLNPKTWVNNICAKLEFYGCAFECQTPMGMEKGRIKDRQLKASSSTDGHEATEARPINKAWCPVATDKSSWFQITFPGIEKRLTQITTWGAGLGGSGYVTKYKLAYSDNGDTWVDYTEKGVVRVFRGNSDLNTPMKHILGEPIVTQFFRIKPLAGATGGMCLRFEIYGCANGCLDPLGLEKGTIEDSWFSASSSLDSTHGPERARLNGPQGWCAANNGISEYLTIDLSRNMRVRRISTQGSTEGYVTSFTLSFKRDDIPWKNMMGNGAITIFTGNADATSVVSTTFPKVVRGRYFRINPKKWVKRICIRVELYGCMPYNRPTPSASPTNSPVDRTEFKVSMRLLNVDWTDDYTKKNSTEYKALSNRVVTAVESVYTGTKSFSQALITGFRRGSVIVDFRLIFIGDAVQTPIDKLKQAVKAGQVGDLKVDPDSFNITEIDGGNAQPQTGRSSGLSSGGKAAIAVVFVIIALAAGAGAAYYFLKKKRSSQFIFKNQQFDNPIHFSSKAYDMDG